MLYLLDANVLITAHNSYYSIEQVPEFWDWLRHQGENGHLKMPLEIIEEVMAGKDGDPLLDWIKNDANLDALKLEESVDSTILQRIVSTGYAPDLTDDELEFIGFDPFLAAYGLAQPDRTVVTTEVSSPKKTRKNRKLPDVCAAFALPCINTFDMTRRLGFRTKWR